MKKLFNLSIEDTTLRKLYCLAAERQYQTGKKFSTTSLINEVIEKYINDCECDYECYYEEML